jgi:transcriptional regulator with XRE-family HTH domain
MNAGRVLKGARHRARMTQRDLAAATDIPQPSIARIERGVSIPRVDTLERLLRATGWELESAPRLGSEIDRSQIRALLALTPDQRGRGAAAAGRNLVNLLNQARPVGRSRRA